MRIVGNILTVVLLKLFLFTAQSTAHIISLKLHRDKRHMIPLSEFEFSNVGYASFVISSVKVTSASASSRPDPSRIGFFLQSRSPTAQKPFDIEQYTTICRLDFKLNSGGTEWFWLEDDQYKTPGKRFTATIRKSLRGYKEKEKPVEGKNGTGALGRQLRSFSTTGGKKPPGMPYKRFRLRPTSLLFTLQNLSNNPQVSLMNSWPVTYSGLKSLFIVNCNNVSSLTMKVRAEVYNMDDCTTKKFLSPGLTHLPIICFIFSIIYVSFLGFWMLVCFKNKRSFNWTHLIMGVLLVMSIVYFMCVKADLGHVKVTGNPNGWDALVHISKAMRDMFLFTVITLIGAGWCFWKPVLEGRDILVLILVIVLQDWANLDPVLPWEAAVPCNKTEMSFVDLICCVAIFFPMWWSCSLLDRIHGTDLNARGYYTKLWLLISLVFVYVLITRGVVLATSTRWANYVVKETSLIVLCMVMFYFFRPVDRKRLNELNEEFGLSTSKSSSSFQSCLNFVIDL